MLKIRVSVWRFKVFFGGLGFRDVGMSDVKVKRREDGPEKAKEVRALQEWEYRFKSFLSGAVRVSKRGRV